jgi:hypothetical protein
MLTYKNIQRIVNMDSKDYFALYSLEDKYYSHSFLKSEQSGQSPYLEITEKIKIGAMADNILTSPDKVNPALPEFRAGRNIASNINQNKIFKPLLPLFVPQVSYMAQITYKGLVMNVCGRLDWEIPKIAAIDLKVTDAKTDKEFAAIIRHMKYDNQMFNYMGMSGTKQAFIIPYSTKANACLSVVKFEYGIGRNEFWENSVIKFGS